MSDDIFDFGFTAVDEGELQAVQQTQALVDDAEQAATTTQDKLDRLYNAITPLLNNLKKNPEKEYILWPNRLKKVEEFESHLLAIYQGE
tara:strand:- start:108 stop:374 length:267 start_codon:yes stop_codon:yes gene_type:complete